ncbi:MFS transporter [Dendrothele bispora CBS 962.96]|uniref:MFS transporter n=1 Tax=Dendrothele bispora (strain CBS 962.96) TaxID=1314807 RepID=A0A4S8LUV4_DENBC|nr:MFS transporter [Dendrothele bispora CBS 962.96]
MASMDLSKEDIEIVEYGSKGREGSTSEYTIDRAAERRGLNIFSTQVNTKARHPDYPSSMFIYLLCSLDRSNIGNARVLNSDTGNSLQQTIHLSNTDYTTALMIFLVAYFLFETPSNYLLKRFTPSRWIAFLMFSWGAMTMCLGAANNFSSLTAIRFLLGMFEAGLFPGLVYFLTFWYRPEERALRVALILASASLAGAFGGAIAYGVGRMNLTSGLEAWRWLFLLEGIPSCALAFIVFFFFPDYPETASSRWLSAEEKELAIERIKGVASLGHDKVTWEEAKETVMDWRLYLHYLLHLRLRSLLLHIPLRPTIVSGLGYSGLTAQLFTVPPYACAYVITCFVSWLSDRYEARSYVAGGSLLIAGIMFIVEGVLAPTAFKARYAVLCFAVSFAFGSIPPLLSWLTANLRSTASATLGVPMNVSMGAIGQIIGVYIYLSKEAPGYPTGHFTNAGFALLGTVVALVLRFVYVRRNRNLAPGEKQWRL